MKKIAIGYGFFCCLWASTLACTKNNLPSGISVKDTVTVRSIASSNPVLKGLAANPLIRLTIDVPATISNKKYQRIHCNINAASVGDIQKIDVYQTGNTAFATDNLLTSCSQLSSSFDIPVNLTAQPGVSFIWLSAVLKDGAAVNKKIEVHCTQLTDDAGNASSVVETISPYAKLSGFAVRRAGDDGVNTFRIPGIITTDKGTLIAVYDIRYNNSADLPGYINIGMSRSTDSGRTWQSMKVIMSMGGPNDNSGIGDPCILFDAQTKKIWVAALWSKGNHSIAGSGPGLLPEQTGQFMLANSSDDGLTWLTPTSITPQVKDPAWKIMFQGPGSGIVMQNGTIVFPAQYWDASGIPYSSIVYSNDKGLSWKRGGSGAKSNTTECQVVETTAGNLMLNMRDNRGSFRSVATTANMGDAWQEHITSYNTLTDPVCQGSFIKARVNTGNGLQEVLFFSNPNTSSGRYNITVKASLDMGQTWLPVNQLLIDERNCYGYSSLTKIDDNTIGLLYEGVKEIYFVQIPVKDIIK